MDGINKAALLCDYQSGRVSEVSDGALRVRFLGESALSLAKAVSYAVTTVFAVIATTFACIFQMKSVSYDSAYWAAELGNRTKKNVKDCAAFAVAFADPIRGLSWAVENSVVATLNTSDYSAQWLEWKVHNYR